MTLQAKLIIAGLIALVLFGAGTFVGIRKATSWQKPCPPTTSNSIEIGKIKKGSVGNLDQAIGTRCDTVYLVPDSVLKYLPPRWQRKLSQRINAK